MAGKKGTSKKKGPSGAGHAFGKFGHSGKDEKEKTKRREESNGRGGIQWAQMRPLGLKIRQVTADGNCLFRAVADQLEGSEAGHVRLRKQTVDFISANQDDYQPFVEDDNSFENYLRTMAEDSTWAGHMELQALSVMVHCNICIHRFEEPRWHIHNFPVQHTRTLHISYHDGEHYNSVRLIDDDSPEPARLITLEADKGLLSNGHASASSRGDPEGLEDKVEEVATQTGCKDLERIREVLRNVGADVDAAYENIIANEMPITIDEPNGGRQDPSMAADQAHGDQDKSGREAGSTGEHRRPYVKKRSKMSRVPREDFDFNGRLLVDVPHEKVGRNQPCPCGSKKKAKACCGRAFSTDALREGGGGGNPVRAAAAARRAALQGGSSPERGRMQPEIDFPDVGALCI
eukprot:TRINITY_DN1235_c7_g1_i1.p1 TRINITY_DN1235_c7_g1~~TRINITY_DN1235_c7_g1_i1.p1  ORF type:complete len:404 (+),score=76.15 TRINITY_DN1235_c7_g1_i1:322-1533(+)